MMSKRVSIKHMRRDAPQWVFSWQRLGRPALARWFPVLWVGVVFAVLLTSVRILVIPPKAWKAHSASLIHVTDDAQGAFLRLKAREGGPFPSRFELREWAASATIEQAALASASWSPPIHVPALRSLPEQAIPTAVMLAERGVAMLPKRSPKSVNHPAPAPSRLRPMLQPLTTIALASVSGELPSFEGEVDGAMAVESWRFLIQLDTAGTVGECISLAGGGEVGQSRLTAWLRKISFKPDLKKSSRWIAVGVGFTNQPENEPIDR